MAEAFGIACHELVSLDFRCGSTPEVRGVARNVCCWGTSGRKSAESRHCRPNVSCWGYNGSQPRTLESPFVAKSRPRGSIETSRLTPAQQCPPRSLYKVWILLIASLQIQRSSLPDGTVPLLRLRLVGQLQKHFPASGRELQRSPGYSGPTS